MDLSALWILTGWSMRQMSLGLTQYIPKSFSLPSHSLSIELFLNLWPYAPSRGWCSGRKHANDWRLVIGGTHAIFPICTQRSELGKGWHSLNDFCLKFIVMNLTCSPWWFCRAIEWQLQRPTQDPWKRESETLNFTTDNKNLGFMQVKSEKETQRVVPLGVGLEDLPASKLEVWMMFDLYFNFPSKDKIFLSQTICINFHF